MSMEKPEIQLLSADGEKISVKWPIVRQFKMVKDKIEDLGLLDEGTEDEPKFEYFPGDANSEVLKIVIQWAEKHKGKSIEEEEAADEKNGDVVVDPLVKKLDPGTLFEIIVAAKHLNIKGLLDQACRHCSDMMKGKSPEELRKIFGIVGDFTEEE